MPTANDTQPDALGCTCPEGWVGRHHWTCRSRGADGQAETASPVTETEPSAEDVVQFLRELDQALGEVMSHPEMVRVDVAVEALAEYAHQAWADYMRHHIDKLRPLADGTRLMGQGYYMALWKLIATPYADLPEEQKEQDREQARRIMAILEGLG